MSHTSYYANLHTYIALYTEYHSLKAKTHVGGNKSHFGTDSKNSVFGDHLNKGKSLKEKKSFCSSNSKTLSWSKHHGWKTFRTIPNDGKGPKSECKEVNEVCIYTLCCYPLVLI